MWTVVLGLLFFAVLSLLIGVGLVRKFIKDKRSSTKDVQDSPVELETTANHKSVDAQQRTASTLEILTTIRELLSIALQIAKNAERVARLAAETASAAELSDGNAREAVEAVGIVNKRVESTSKARSRPS